MSTIDSVKKNLGN
jgi:hypothetical protein